MNKISNLHFAIDAAIGTSEHSFYKGISNNTKSAPEFENPTSAWAPPPPKHIFFFLDRKKGSQGGKKKKQTIIENYCLQ
jgi:hypothetical protein